MANTVLERLGLMTMNTPPHSNVIRPIAHGWLGTATTGSANYDEFASDADVTAAIGRRPQSALSIEMPHRTQAAVDAEMTFIQALDSAQRDWTELTERSMREVADVVGVYRIGGIDEFFGMFCLVDTGQISSSAAEAGAVIRNEDVFIAKVRERVALTRQLGAVLSPVLLLQSGDTTALHSALVDVVKNQGEPAVSDTDEHGYEHQVWLLGPGAERDRLLSLAQGQELIVADGNHRTLAAQLGGLTEFLAVITTADSVGIAAYNRLVHSLGGLSIEELIAELREAGAVVAPVAEVSPSVGEIGLVTKQGCWRVTLPLAAGSIVDGMDHSLVETVLFGKVLGMDAGDKRISYIGGDYSPAWLSEQVETGAAELAVLIAPVTVDDFVAVNMDRLKLPRKSTWFVPKARAGLLCAQVSTDVPAQGLG